MEISEAKGELQAAAQELTQGKEAAEESRRITGDCLAKLVGNIEVVDNVIDSLLAIDQVTADIFGYSQKSYEHADAAARRIGSLGIESMDSEKARTLSSVIVGVADKQYIHTQELAGYNLALGNLVAGLGELRKNMVSLQKGITEDLRPDNPEVTMFPQALEQIRAVEEEI